MRNPNDLNIPLGDGLFRELGLAHSKIDSLRRQYQRNPIINNAFKVIADADQGFQSDIRSMTDFLHARRDSGSNNPTTVGNMISHDLNLLKGNRRLFARTPDSWCVKRLVDDSVLLKAKKMIQQHPSLLKGQLPKALRKYKSKEVSALKTALMYASLAKDPRYFKAKDIKGAYQLPLNSRQKAALQNMHLVRGLGQKYLYAPLNSYVLRADQRKKIDAGHDVMMADCSGYVTNVFRKIFGADYPRLFTFDYAAFHDYKMMQRNDTSSSQMGPIVGTAGRRTNLTNAEKSNARAWKRSHARSFNYLQDHFNTVKYEKSLKTGDVLVWRNKSATNARGRNAKNGHIGIVLDKDVARNRATIMENTAGGIYGIGVREVPIVRSTQTTRVLRPKNL